MLRDTRSYNNPFAPTGAPVERAHERRSRKTKLEKQWEDNLSPEKRDVGQRLLETINEYEAKYGKPGLKRIMAILKAPKEKREAEMRNAVSEMPPPREEFQRDAFKRLEKAGVLRYHKGQMVVDVDRLKSTTITLLLKEKSGYTGLSDFNRKYKSYLDEGRLGIMHELFKNKTVLSEEDARLEKPPKPLFYEPQTEDEAMNPEQIKKADFYLGYWELSRLPMAGRDLLQPSSSLRLPEVAISALIYHPKYGDGKRSANGVLMVKHPKTRERIQFSGSLFSEYNFAGGIYKKDEQGEPIRGSTIGSPREYLPIYAPRILENDLLRLDDFRMLSLHEDTGKRGFERSKVSPTGTVMIRGVTHYLGRQFMDKPIRVHDLAPGVGAISSINPSGKEEIRYTFSTFEQDDPRLTRLKWGSGTRGSAGAKLTNLQPYDQSTFFKKRPDETVDDFKRRIEAVENIQLSSSAVSKVERSGGVQLSAFDRDTQSVINEALMKRSAGDMENIAKKLKPFGADGLRAFAEFDRGRNKGEQLVNIIDSLGVPLMRSLIAKYLAVIDAANDLTAEAVKQTLTRGAKEKLESKDISRHMRERADAILVSIGKRGESKEATAEDILSRLSNVETDIVLLASVVRGVKEITGKPLNVSELAGLGIRSVKLGEINSDERRGIEKGMRALLDANWADKGKDAAAAAKEGFEMSLKNEQTATRFHLLEKDGKMLGFMRFDDRPDLGKNVKYAGSFNVVPALQNASLGSAFFRETLASEGKENAILAHALAADRAASLYVEDFGFTITGVERDKSKNGKEVAWFTIRRNEDAGGKLKERKKEFPKNSRVFTNLPDFLSWVEQETSKGKVISRYKISSHGKLIFYEAASERASD